MAPALQALTRLYLLLLLLASPTFSADTSKRDEPSRPVYLSSSKRSEAPKTFGLFSFSRHPATLGTYDPLLGVRDIILHQGLAEGVDRTTSTAGVMEVAEDVKHGLRDQRAQQRPLAQNLGNASLLVVESGREYSDRVLWMHEGHRTHGQSPQGVLRRQQDEEGTMEAEDAPSDNDEPADTQATESEFTEDPVTAQQAEAAPNSGDDAATPEDTQQDAQAAPTPQSTEEDEWEWVDEDASDPPEEECDDSLPPVMVPPAAPSPPSPPLNRLFVARENYFDHVVDLERRRKNKNKHDDDEDDEDDDDGGRGRYGDNGKHQVGRYGGGRGGHEDDEEEEDHHRGSSQYGKHGSSGRAGSKWKNDDEDTDAHEDRQTPSHSSPKAKGQQGDFLSALTHAAHSDSAKSSGNKPNHDSMDPDTIRAGYKGGGGHRLAQSAYGTAFRADCSRLMQFYRAMNGDGWINKAGWNDMGDKDCCGWFGVTCRLPGTDGPATDQAEKRGWKDDFGDGRRGGSGKQADKWNDDEDDEDEDEDEGWKDHKPSSDKKASTWDKSDDTDEASYNSDGDFEGGNGGTGSIGGPGDDGVKRVIALSLANNGLSGTLSDYLFALDALIRIDVSQNAITALPDRFSTLSHLTHFRAQNNSLSGSVPSSLVNSPTLTNLNLAGNALTGDVSVSAPKLLSLSVQGNKLQTVSINSARLLQKVYLGENAFTSPLPDLSQSKGLTVFDASNNTTGTLFDMSNLVNLTHFDVRSNNLAGPLPTSFSTLTSLKSLYLSSNGFTGPFPSEKAPPRLSSCSITPNPYISPCPDKAQLDDPQSLASRCHASCAAAPAAIDTSSTSQAGPNIAGTVAQVGTKGIPVSPLPGEAGSGVGPVNSPVAPVQPAQAPPVAVANSPLAVPGVNSSGGMAGVSSVGPVAPLVPGPVGAGGAVVQAPGVAVNTEGQIGGGLPAPRSGAVGERHMIGENASIRVARGSSGKQFGIPSLSVISIISLTLTWIA